MRHEWSRSMNERVCREKYVGGQIPPTPLLPFMIPPMHVFPCCSCAYTLCPHARGEHILILVGSIWRTLVSHIHIICESMIMYFSQSGFSGVVLQPRAASDMASGGTRYIDTVR